MAFTPKDWKNRPNTSTPLSAAAIKDLEARLAAYAEEVAADIPLGPDGPPGLDGGVVRSVKDVAYGGGAVGNGTTDDTAAIQACIDVAKVSGGTVFFPPGTYKVTSTLDLTAAHGIGFTGPGQGGFEEDSLPLINYTAGTGNLLDCRSAKGLLIKELSFNASHVSYSGDLLNFGTTGADCIYNRIERCAFNNLSRTCNSFLLLTRFIIGSVKDCLFHNGGASHIYFGVGGSYCVGSQIDGCSHHTIASTGHAIYGPSGLVESVTISNGVFEPRADGSASGIRIPSAGGYGVRIENNWWGDISVAGGTPIWVRSLGGSIKGNRIADVGSTDTHIYLDTECTAMVIAGNRGQGGAKGIDGDASSCAIIGNDFPGTTNAIAATSNLTSCVVLATGPNQMHGTGLTIETTNNEYVVPSGASVNFEALGFGYSSSVGQASAGYPRYLNNNGNLVIQPKEDCSLILASGSGPTRGIEIGGGNIGFYGHAPAARPSAYTITNPTTDRSLNVTGDTLPQVAEVLGTLIADLQSLGLLQ